ncbi:hypothetical protein [Micromonospora carbonacea]|uniref:hypothetical protein n=1 Tax=Micromonospora carbonacea TaxID=47853 RepID=UPI003D7561C1
MKPGPLPGVAVPDEPGDPAAPPRRAPLPARLGRTEPSAGEPLAVVAAGPAGAARRDVLAALLGLAPERLAVPPGSWLLVDHARVSTRAAYVPGYRQPHAYAPDGSATGPALARPPRRVELTVAEPLLRRFAVVDTPDTGTLGLAGGRLLLDAVGRAGALLFVIAADQAFSAAELRLLAEVAALPAEVFFVVTPGLSGWAAPPELAASPESAGSPELAGSPESAGPPELAGSPGPADPPAPAGSPDLPDLPGSAGPAGPPGSAGAVDPAGVAVAAHRAALLAAVPGLAGARWYPARPDDIEALRRAVVGWAADEGLRRCSAQPPEPPGAHDRVPVLPGAEATDWAGQLERQARSCAQRIRQDIALELADTHLRVVQEIVFGVGCAGLPQLLDRELEVLSLFATALCDRAVRAICDDAAERVLGGPVPDGVRRRIAEAVRFGLDDHAAGRGLDRVLLVTSTAGVAELTGPGASDALRGYPGAERPEVLPPIAVGLSGGCWQRWRGPGNDDPGGARAWAQRALREVELELTREVSRRFEAVRLSLGTVLADALDHGILLA